MSCGSCSGNCGGCGRELTLSEGEIRMLEELGQIPFLPIARRMDDETPVYLESGGDLAEMSLILQLLEKKGLVSLDFDQPLKDADLARYAGYPIRGSMALTARGQAVLDMIQIQGIQE